MRPDPASSTRRRRARLALPAILLALAAMSLAQVFRTSTTFDEIVLVAAGARALETGSWSLVVDQPPVMPFLYGLPFRVADVTYPSEIRERMLTYDDRWEYARDFFFRTGNDPERLALLARLVALALALGLVGVVYLYGSWIDGPTTGLIAAFLVAFFPDVVAHGAVAYNDVPLALAYLLAVWALDAAVRGPGLVRGALAGLAVALALGVKFSALALGPVAALLLVAHAFGRDRTKPGTWGRDVTLTVVVAAVAGWAALALMYRWDPWLVGLEYGIRFTIEHASEGHPAPAWLFGATSPDGWWYFFPVALFVKTPAALALLAPLALLGGWLGSRGRVREMRREAAGGSPRARRSKALLASRARGPLVGGLVFAGFLVASSLNVGTRYALPAIPPLLLLVSLGLARLWVVSHARWKAGQALLLALYAGSTISVFPFFLSYRSEWFRGAPPGEEPLLDSSLDWGQGLIALREWMEEEGAERVRLSYFGSALPGGYGIAYERLPSFLRLPPSGTPVAGGAGQGGAGQGGPASRGGTDPPGDQAAATWTAVSATNLHGLYLDGDPFAAYRERAPDRVLAGSIYLYRD